MTSLHFALSSYFYMYHKYLPTQCTAFRKNHFSGMVIKTFQLNSYLPGSTLARMRECFKDGIHIRDVFITSFITYIKLKQYNVKKIMIR